MIKMLSLITFSTDPIDHSQGEPQCNLSNRYRYGIDFKNPFTMSNREAVLPNAGAVAPNLWSSSFGKMLGGGAYRDRTDDLMLAKQPLSQLS
jgi:hypothetical protein